MQADGFGNGLHAAIVVNEVRVEVVDRAQAVAPELQRVGVASEPVFTCIERTLPEVRRTRIAVRHHHFGVAASA